MYVLKIIEICEKRMAKESDTYIISEQLYYNIIRRIVRAPRPALMIWVFRSCTPVRLPQSSYATIVKKAGQQIWGVTLFLLFFLVFYGILGVQMFGNFENHCVRSWSSEINEKENKDQWLNRLTTGNVSYIHRIRTHVLPRVPLQNIHFSTDAF